MSASDHLHPQQLAMFMPAKQIMDKVSLMDTNDQSPEGKKHLMDFKQSNNAAGARHGSPNADDGFKGGVHTPVVINHSMVPGGPNGSMQLLDGHHRLAHSLSQGSNTEVPVEHMDNKNPPMRVHRDNEQRQRHVNMMKRAKESMPKGAF
jgi:hypothetical protein